MLHGDVNEKVLTGHAKVRASNKVFPRLLVGGIHVHVVALSDREPVANGELEFSRRTFGRGFGVKDLFTETIGIDREWAKVSGDG